MDPQVGFDAAAFFLHGNPYSVEKAGTGKRVNSGEISAGNREMTDASSGDRDWHFDFSTVSETGTYYVLDEEKHLRSAGIN